MEEKSHFLYQGVVYHSETKAINSLDGYQSLLGCLSR